MTTHNPYLILVYTHYVGPTDTKGSRIVATAQYFGERSKVTHPYLPEYSGQENHKTAAFKFLGKRLGDADRANFELLGIGDHPKGSGMTFVFKRVGA